ncbi:MAG: metallophosphoesterase family protein [Thermoleophilia bacterium]|nr:metallophosphoesterase family protein [Thermoleophilia bacterium]
MRLHELVCPVPGLPEELAGVRVAHLSDFHLGVPSRGERAAAHAVAWAAERRPELVCLTGDLVTRPAGLERLRALTARVPGAYAVLGNHDIGYAKDPLVRRADPFDAGPVTLLRDEAATAEIRGVRVQLIGVDPRSYLTRTARPAELVDDRARLRILLCHFPAIVERLPEGAFHLVLAGHLHDGQIAVPYGRGKVRLGYPRAPYPHGRFLHAGAALHVSAGLGTSLLPMRFFARPEATELVLQPA